MKPHFLFLSALLFLIGCQSKKNSASSSSPFQPIIEDPVSIGDNKFLSPGTIFVNDGAEFTNGTQVVLSLYKEDAVQMKISQDPSCSSGEWLDFEHAKLWNLDETLETHWFSAQFRNQQGTQSECSSTSIISDRQPPLAQITLDPTNTGFSDTAFKLSLQVMDSGVGVRSLRCKLNAIPVSCLMDPQGSSFLTWPRMNAGTYFLQVYTDDQLGNASIQEIGWTIRERLKSVNQKYELLADTKVDILFVMDNSISMAKIQKNMAERTGSLLTQLQDLDWQIAVITTDTRNIATGDGRLLPMATVPTKYFLDRSLPLADAQVALAKTLQRTEIGSKDEQGIYTTYRAIERSLDPLDTSNRLFFRKDAALSTIVVSDEDESGSGIKNDPFQLLQFIRTTWKGQKNFVFNSIIVKPGDRPCLTQQGSVYGEIYANLSKITGLDTVGGAVIGSVCETDYSPYLTNLGQRIQQIHQSIQLECAPIDGKVDVLFEGSTYLNPSELSGFKLSFSEPLMPGKYELKYICENN